MEGGGQGEWKREMVLLLLVMYAFASEKNGNKQLFIWVRNVSIEFNEVSLNCEFYTCSRKIECYD